MRCSVCKQEVKHRAWAVWIQYRLVLHPQTVLLTPEKYTLSVNLSPTMYTCISRSFLGCTFLGNTGLETFFGCAQLCGHFGYRQIRVARKWWINMLFYSATTTNNRNNTVWVNTSSGMFLQVSIINKESSVKFKIHELPNLNYLPVAAYLCRHTLFQVKNLISSMCMPWNASKKEPLIPRHLSSFSQPALTAARAGALRNLP